MNSAIQDKTIKINDRASKRDAVIANVVKSQARATNEKQFQSSYETIFSDVVTPHYIRGYN